MADNAPRPATGSGGAPTAAVSTSANAGDGSAIDSLGARGDLAISAVVTEQSGLMDVPLGGQPTAEGQEQPVQPPAPHAIATALTLGYFSTKLHLARGGELGDATPGGHLGARVEQLRRDLAARPVAGRSASEPQRRAVGEPLTETVSLRSRGAEAMDTGVGGGAPMDVDAPTLMKDMIGAKLEEVVEYVSLNGAFTKRYASPRPSGENFRKAHFEVNWGEGLPPEDLASEELLEALTSCSLEMLRRKLEQTDASSSSPPRNCEGRADFEGVESGVEGASSGSGEDGAVDEELLKAVAAACAVLTFALISGRDGVVVTLWINGGWLKLHGGHYNTHYYLVLAIEEGTCELSTFLKSSFDKLGLPMQWDRQVTTGRVGYFRELAALCAFTLDPAEAERLCANLRHMVYNPSKYGTGNSLYEHDEVLQKYAARVAGGKLQALLDVFKAPAFGACNDAGAKKTNRNGERRNAKSHAIREADGNFYVLERSTRFDIAYFDSHAKAAGLVFVLDSPILDVYFRRAVAHLDGFLAPCLRDFVREAAPLRAFCAELDLGDFATWAKGASMMEAAATPVLYFEGEVDEGYMRDTIALAFNQGLRGDYTLWRRFSQLDYQFRKGKNVAFARWLDVFEDVRDDLEKPDASISWSPLIARLENLVARARREGMKRGSSKGFPIFVDAASLEDDDDFEELHAIAEESPAEADLDASVGAARVDAYSNGAGASVGAGASTTASAFARPRLPISTEAELREKLAKAPKQKKAKSAPKKRWNDQSSARKKLWRDGAGLKTEQDWEDYHRLNFLIFRDFTVEDLKKKYREMKER